MAIVVCVLNWPAAALKIQLEAGIDASSFTLPSLFLYPYSYLGPKIQMAVWECWKLSTSWSGQHGRQTNFLALKIISIQSPTCHSLVNICGCQFNSLMDALKPHSNVSLYRNTVIRTLVVGWAVSYGTARRGLGGLRPCPVFSSLTKCNSAQINGLCTTSYYSTWHNNYLCPLKG